MDSSPPHTPSGARAWRHLTGVPAETVHPGTALSRLLAWCEAQGASDLHGQAGKPYALRVQGRLTRVPAETFPAPTDDGLYRAFEETFSPTLCQRIEQEREVDLSFYHGPLRYRANFSKQLGRQSFSFRTVPPQQFRLRDLQLPESLRTLVDEPRGLVLVTGPAGQGKSTTVRALIQELNETRACRIITIEDPIEYIFTDRCAQFEQREVGLDTASFADGIRNAMRQDPNVIFVGEIRDRESIFAAMQAAETGHLVLSTLHADSVAQAIGRLREHYPVGEQDGLSGLLARNLNAMVCQRLLPNVQGTRTPCVEVMRRNRGIQDAVAANDLTLLTGIMEAAVHEGMHSFDQYLTELLAAGVITRETALTYAVNRHRLEMTLRGFHSPAPILRQNR
ncbi:MAG TPA: PilT/PilU family type 4a pilus ATPase [Verrucomicrobiota bacterium]|nr:PilT/PilU family type 4a pilus ATPase [Verrucomicrobiota bacterium]HNU52648.1 PilT/PilU family type 4a pilus ATPase [Verrucomicrobiota bacterium]